MGVKLLFWKSHLTGWRDSGLSQAAYCRQHDLRPVRTGSRNAQARRCIQQVHGATVASGE